ncbi:tellurite resistance TerB family protein [Tepidamorphus sp. 3E244]|uniref:tellurite resistance TerB family protein n=1 Tax=Tepidamorphus sp. 3E244 TaxID=3385498 RepID=UPI0038FCCC8A
MIDAKALLDQYLGADTSQRVERHANDLKTRAQNNPLAATAIAGGIASLLLGTKTGRKLGGKALKYGGMAAVAGLAYKAYQDWQAKQNGNQRPGGEPVMLPPEDTDFIPDRGHEQDRAQSLIVAMIQAAKADGHIDDEERSRIIGKVDTLGLGEEELEFVIREIRAPLDVDKVVKAATSPEVAMELYTASSVAVDIDHPAERAYLDMLAARLNIDPALKESLDETIGAARETV